MSTSDQDQRSTSSLLASYWGKADPEAASRGPDHHTVLGHSLDVAACAFTLVDMNPTLRAQLSARSGIPGDAVAVTFAAACALHDLGKFDTRFQRKAPRIADVLRPHTAMIPTGKYDHGTEGFRQLEDDEEDSRQLHALFGPDALRLLRAVCGHHGALPSREEPDPSRSRLPRSVRREDAEVRRVFVKCVAGFFVARGAALPWPAAVDGALVQCLAGLCALADWLGSDIDHFPYARGPLADLDSYWARARERAITACRRAGLSRATPAVTEFGRLFPGYSPRDVQLLTEQVVTDTPALVIVEAEMGKGKTEAALSMAARFMMSNCADGMTMALPTMATSNAMFERVKQLAPRLFPSEEVQLALAHSRAARQAGFQSLVQRDLRARDEDAPEASVMCARWLLHKKRILLAQIGVGTIDQALKAALVARHQFVRMFGLSRNVVIVDEVHAYDAYMEVLLEHLLGWLGALGVSTILLSATLPSERRAALARAWQGAAAQGDDTNAGSAISVDDLVTARKRPYPLVSVTTRARTTTLAGEAAGTSRTLFLERAIAAESEVDRVEAVARRLVRAAKAGGRVVWIRNTVREAQRAFGAVHAYAGAIEHHLFHARFRGRDRSKIEETVLARFGKDAPVGGRVLIATQVVEQSLDLDFDEMHTDLAPIDLLFQRAGRLHRHPHARLPGFERPQLVVHVPSVADIAALRFGPSAFVYDTGTLWIADQALRKREVLEFPGDIRLLVEESYHPASRATLLANGGQRLVAADQKRASELDAKRTKARRCCIPPTTADPDGQSVLPDDDAAVDAFTRDGTSATVLPFAWDGEAGRALDADEGFPAWQLDAALTDAWRLAHDLADQTLSLPARSETEGSVTSSEGSAWDRFRKRFARFADESGMGSRVVPLPMKRDGDNYKGWIRMGGKRRRVLYSPLLGLMMPSEKDEEQAR